MLLGYRFNLITIITFMKLKIDQENYLIIDPAIGGKIIELKLAGRLVIAGKQQRQLGSGSYLMYPWVNRVETLPFPQNPPYKDENGIPLHGFYVDTQRRVTILNTPQGSICLQLVPEVEIQDVPKFTQTFILTKGKLHQKIKILNQNNQKLPNCFGYHPYLQIGNEEVVNLKINTDIKTKIRLNQKLMVSYPYQKQNIEIKTSQRYDDLFEGGTFLQITNGDGFNVKISSEMPYWQIYTPPDRKRIAVEPMSFTGNVYKITETGFSPKLFEGEFTIEAWLHKQ